MLGGCEQVWPAGLHGTWWWDPEPECPLDCHDLPEQIRWTAPTIGNVLWRNISCEHPSAVADTTWQHIGWRCSPSSRILQWRWVGICHRENCWIAGDRFEEPCQGDPYAEFFDLGLHAAIKSNLGDWFVSCFEQSLQAPQVRSADAQGYKEARHIWDAGKGGCNAARQPQGALCTFRQP